MTPLPESCPRWHRCGASVCPLAPHQGVHLQGEKVCFYALASGKAGAAERFAEDATFALVVRALPEVKRRWPDIARRVEAASRSGFQGAHLIRARPARNAVSDVLTLEEPPGGGPTLA